MKRGDLVRFTPDGTYGIVTAISEDSTYVFVEWLDGKVGWHVVTYKLEIINVGG